MLQRQVRDLVKADNPALSLLNKTWLDQAVEQDPSAIDTAARYTFERALDLAVWFDIHNPTIKL